MPFGLPLEVWCIIFENSDPGSLLNIRLVCQEFQSAIHPLRIWVAARRQTYGAGCPDPPGAMTEIRYATLLSRSECEGADCRNKRSRKILWIFKMRLCESCLEKRFISEQATARLLLRYAGLDSLLLHFRYDSQKKYLCTGTYNPKPAWLSPKPSSNGFHLQACFQGVAKILELDKVSDTERTERLNSLRADRDSTLSELQACETFFENLRYQKEIEKKNTVKVAKAFIERRCLELNPPIPRQVLEYCPTYEKLNTIAKQMTEEKVWETARLTLSAEQPLAVRICARNVHYRNSLPIRSAGRGKVLMENVRQVLSAIVDKVILHLGTGTEQVADEDVGLLVLRRVRRGYEELLSSQKPTCEDEARPYRLRMQDTWDLLLDNLNGWMERRQLAASMGRLKCLPCSQKGVQRGQSFEKLMEHIFRRHVLRGGECIDWPCLDIRMATSWQELEWPSNLPILAEHQASDDKWDPNRSLTYQHARRSMRYPPTQGLEAQADAESDERSSETIFNSRIIGDLGHPGQCFYENVLFAAEQFEQCQVQQKFRARIAIEFAVRKSSSVWTSHRPIFEQLQQLDIELGLKGHHDFFHGFSCGVDSHACSLFASKSHSFSDLLHHYRAFHMNVAVYLKDWMSRIFPYPPAAELLAALQQDAQLNQVFSQLFPLPAPVATMARFQDDSVTAETAPDFGLTRNMMGPGTAAKLRHRLGSVGRNMSSSGASYPDPSLMNSNVTPYYTDATPDMSISAGGTGLMTLPFVERDEDESGDVGDGIHSET